jgi:polar amino acid transport system substrate-binding protein
MVEHGTDAITIDEHPDDAAGFRKLAARRLDAVFSNRDRGWDIVSSEGLDGRVRYAGRHKALVYYAGITKAYPDDAVVERFFAAWRGLFASGEGQRIIEGYGLEPAEAE